jgi:hypothetical protein
VNLWFQSPYLVHHTIAQDLIIGRGCAGKLSAALS